MYSSVITFIAAAALMIIVSGQIPAFAQAPQQSPAEQAMAQKLGQEMSENINLRAAIIKLQGELDALKPKGDASVGGTKPQPEQPKPEKFPPK